MTLQLARGDAQHATATRTKRTSPKHPAVSEAAQRSLGRPRSTPWQTETPSPPCVPSREHQHHVRVQLSTPLVVMSSEWRARQPHRAHSTAPTSRVLCRETRRRIVQRRKLDDPLYYSDYLHLGTVGAVHLVHTSTPSSRPTRLSCTAAEVSTAKECRGRRTCSR